MNKNNTILKLTQKSKGFIYEGQLCKIDGRACVTKRALFTTFVTSLNFPDYFGYNWDSFEECFNDVLSASSYVGILVVNGEDICSEDSEDRITFFSICSLIDNIDNLKSIYIEFNTDIGYLEAKRLQIGLTSD